MKNKFAFYLVVGLLFNGMMYQVNAAEGEDGNSPYGEWGKAGGQSRELGEPIVIREKPSDWTRPKVKEKTPLVIGSRKSPDVKEPPLQESLQRVDSDLADEVKALRVLLQQSQGEKEEESFNPEENPVRCFRWLCMQEGLAIAQDVTAVGKRGYIDPASRAPISQPPFSQDLQNRHDWLEPRGKLQLWKEAKKKDRRDYQEASRLLKEAEESGSEELEDRRTNYQKILKKLQAEHWIRDDKAEKGIRPLTVQELEKNIVYGFRLKTKDLTPPYSKQISRISTPNVNIFTVTDPVEVRIGIYMLTSRLAYLKRENEILKDIRVQYKSKYVPDVSGISKAVLKWQESESFLGTPYWNQAEYKQVAKVLRDAHRIEGMWPENREFSEPETDEEVVLRLFRIDALGTALRGMYKIKKYEDQGEYESTQKDQILDQKYRELEVKPRILFDSDSDGKNPSKSFAEIYRGSDIFFDEKWQGPSEKKDQIQRFLRAPETKLYKVQQHQIFVYSEEDLKSEDRRLNPVGQLVPFSPAKGVHLMELYCAPDRFERSFRYEVMKELLSRKGVFQTRSCEPIKKQYSAQQIKKQFEKYSKLYSEFQEVHAENIRILRELQKSPFYFGRDPIPFEFFFSRSKLEKTPPEREDKIDLRNLGTITDDHVVMYRTLPGGFVEPVFTHYKTINLQGNMVRFNIPYLDSEMPNVEDLNISNCNVQSLSHVIALPTLKVLNASMNPLQFSEDEIMKNDQLEELYLSRIGTSNRDTRNRDTRPVLLCKIDFLPQFPALRVLNLSQNEIAEIEPLRTLTCLEAVPTLIFKTEALLAWMRKQTSRSEQPLKRRFILRYSKFRSSKDLDPLLSDLVQMGCVKEGTEGTIGTGFGTF